MTEGVSSLIVAADATASVHDKGVVFFHAGTGRLFTSNLIGAHIWRGLEQQVPVAAIAAGLSATYGVAPATGIEHTTRFVAALEREQLVARRAAR